MFWVNFYSDFKDHCLPRMYKILKYQIKAVSTAYLVEFWYISLIFIRLVSESSSSIVTSKVGFNCKSEMVNILSMSGNRQKGAYASVPIPRLIWKIL